ncbi:MAG TPA: lytic murein transglycosylase [Solirubrobacteraceae bacterium]|jgi:murein DD-endopeptidase MepM/ murein hydrolase activator NlpD|nr:lytic murein transglycosylase [Solirubrobacteraceae bacterium]
MRAPRHPLPVLVCVLALALCAAAAAGASGETSSGSTAGTETVPASTNTTTTTVPAPEAPAGVHGQVGEPVAEGEGEASATTETVPAPPAETGAPATTTPTTPATAAGGPEVSGQRPQTPSAPGTSGGHANRGAQPGAGKHTGNAAKGKGGGKGAKNAGEHATGAPAPPPSTLTPPLPGALGAAIGGIPDFFIESFRVPPFLLPIYQAAGAAYDIPWQVLAAINEVETNYGRDLSVSSAGAEGWMQFLPSSWARYGVDATGSGYEDPYNPADAIFAAARYLEAAGGAGHIREAVLAYNHSAAYVEAVMLRAQLLGGTPPELLSAISGLTESRFPVHAEAHFSDGFPADPADPAKTLAGTVIYAPAGAPVIAVQDGEITAAGDSPTLGRYVSLRDAYGNTYTYAQLGEAATVYPVLEPRVAGVSARIAHPGGGAGVGPAPTVPASAGVQPHSPLSQAAVTTGLAMGAANALETPPAPHPTTPPPTLPKASAGNATGAPAHQFREGPNEVYLDSLHPGVQVLAGTVLGHVGAEAHVLFQIRPGGAGAPLIDPKPILDGWVRLEETSAFRAKGENPFLATSPTVGQVLLASKPQLEQMVLRDPGVRLPACERGAVRAGEVDRRVLAALEYLSVSGLSPTVSSRGCPHTAGAPGAGNTIGAAGDAVDIAAIDGTPIAGNEGAGSVTDVAVRKLLRLQGTMKPAQIVSAISLPGSDNTLTLPGYKGVIHVAFASAARHGAVAARVSGSPLSPTQWLRLISQIGEIPEPEVSSQPSAAAVPDPGTTGSGGE